MSEQLDLSQIEIDDDGDRYWRPVEMDFGTGLVPVRLNDVLAEALRAQASEDALKERVRVLEEALIWCSGSEDFQQGGKAEVGWNRVCRPLIAITGGKGEG